MSEWDARLGLSLETEPGDPSIASDVERLGVEEVWHRLTDASVLGSVSSAAEKRAREARRDSALNLAGRVEARFIVPGDAEWPQSLDDLAAIEPFREQAGVPLGLWIVGAGNLADVASQSVTIEGARAATAYGETVAAEIAGDLAAAGYSIISGGAYGVDAAAHRAALASRTPTVVVLASGVDRAYPAAHSLLFDRVAATGLVVSEVAPGQHPTRNRFLARSRILAALSQGTVLVEAAARSGALSTVRWANRLSRPTMAVPGPITSAQSYLPHRLISDGDALLVTSAADVCQALDHRAATRARQSSPVGWEHITNQRPRPSHDRPAGVTSPQPGVGR